jgi:hypothetical protein
MKTLESYITEEEYLQRVGEQVQIAAKRLADLKRPVPEVVDREPNEQNVERSR